ncbi:MAG: glycosyltransferase [Gammaproteobacteria bacterium]|nr:glycosyltransferase [Gammaproteobacteria bacterium]
MNTERRQSRSDLTDRRTPVLHVGKYFPPFSGGMENFLADLLRALVREGINAQALVHDHRPRLRAGATRESINGMEPKGFQDSQPDTIRVYRASSFGRVLYTPVSPQFPFCLNQVIRAERPRILHFHLPNPSVFWAMALPAARRIPWIVHWHSDVVPSEVDRRMKLVYPVYRQLEQRLLDRATAVVVSSQPYLETSKALAVWRHKCRVTPLGLDPARIPEVSDDALREAEKSWGDASFRILSVGRLTYYKGFEYLVKAMEDLAAFRALIVGEGEHRSVVEKAISESRLNKRVVLAGHQPPESLHALMQTCHCVCLPSIERTEAFGMVLLEAMAHRKPAVVCDIYGSGVSWVVRDGETGIVVPPADPAALAEAFRALAADRESLSRMGLQGWQRYQKMFHIDRISGEVLELYRSIANKTASNDR